MASAKRKTRRDRDVVRTAVPAEKIAKRLRLPRLTRISPDYVNTTLGNKSGFATYALEVGDATYRGVVWSIESTAEVVGVTTLIAGRHMVDVEHLTDYLGEVRIVANGSNMQSLDMAELEQRNTYHNIDFGAHYEGYAFPGATMYDDRRYEDAFALGTKGMKSLTLELQLKAAFDANTMEIIVTAHCADMVRPPGFTYTTERQNYTFASAGQHTYWDLPIGDDVKDIWIMGANITDIELEVDGDQMFKMDRAQYEAYLISQGRDPSVMAGEWFLDFHADGDARSLAALDRPGERKRDARIKLQITTADASTPVEFLVTHADIYSRIR